MKTTKLLFTAILLAAATNANANDGLFYSSLSGKPLVVKPPAISTAPTAPKAPVSHLPSHEELLDIFDITGKITKAELKDDRLLLKNTVAAQYKLTAADKKTVDKFLVNHLQK